MADNTVPICVSSENPIKLLKWKVKQRAFVSQGQILFLYNDSSGGPTEIKKFKALRSGTIASIKVKEGEIAEPNSCVAALEECRHPTVMKDMCAECGADLRTDDAVKRDTAVVPMVHSVPELKVSEELAQKLGREDADRLLKDRKLVLLVDLDQTLVHTTNDNVPNNLKDVHHFFLQGGGVPGRWCHTRLRPGTQTFLKSAAKYFELHVCTFGARQYAHAIAEILDPKKKYFSHRILSRDECFDARTKSANLKALFPCGDNMVCIIDDREDVWRHAANLIHVRPYTFFQSTGDINAPPVDEKAKLISGKNGGPVINEMPSLDNETETKKYESDDQQMNETIQFNENVPTSEPKLPKSDENEAEKTIEGDNGKIVATIENNKDSVESKEIPLTNEQNDEKLKKLGPAGQETKWKETADGQIEVEDPDDYLMYLEDILSRIHGHFYKLYDKQTSELPDLKWVIPVVKKQVLSGLSLVFSGLVPTNQRLETSRAYQVARSLGAQVTQDFTNETTHLVAVRSGTAKVNEGRKISGKSGRPLIVSPDWLWCCAERWQRADERLFPLLKGGQSSVRRPPAHCSSPPPPARPAPARPAPAPPGPRRRTPSGKFMDTINPLLSFSSDDIADMDREVEDIFNESDESSSESEAQDDDLDDEENPPEDRLLTVDPDESSREPALGNVDFTNTYDEETLSGSPRPRKRVRRSSAPSDEEEPPDDDNSWNLMGAALEREFLALD